MRVKFILTFIWIIGLSFTLIAQKSAQVSSPDGLIVFKLELTGKSPEYMVHPTNAYLNIGNGRFYTHCKMSSIKGFINRFF